MNGNIIHSFPQQLGNGLRIARSGTTRQARYTVAKARCINNSNSSLRQEDECNPNLQLDTMISSSISSISCLFTAFSLHPAVAQAQDFSSDQAFQFNDQLSNIVSDQLQVLSPLSVIVIFIAGLLTSLSPCTLSVLPLTIGYIGGFTPKDEEGNAPALLPRGLSFALGLATTLALLGVVSASLGKAYGSIGSFLPVAVGVIAILMGLNLLEVIQVQLPSLNVDTNKIQLPPVLSAYLAGLTFALAASPCSTPVLATLLAYVASTQDLVTGGGLLLSYTMGYVGPLLIAATFTDAMQRLLAMRSWSGVIPTASGVLLVGGGTYSLLSRLFPG